MKLEGKVALVTGGAQGIGRAIAERFSNEGARVVIADIAADAAAQTADAIGGDAFSVHLDVCDEASIKAMVATCTDVAGGIDILVNNAAVFDMAPLLDESRERWDRLFDVNVKGMFFTLQAVAAQMVEQGRGGKIINMASQAGRRGESLVVTYCATKAAVISITQSCGLGLIEHGINVNAISPGVVDTPMWDTVDALFAQYENRPLGEKKREVGESVPAGRMGMPSDHCGCSVFLASEDSNYVVAQTFNVDGGNWMS